MASTRFTVLTGHLSQHSLADLIGILRHQRKTGRLLIEYVGSPAVLFFKDGDLVDAQYNTLKGVQAIFVAFVQPAAAFNFNPLIQPTRYSIDSEQQRVILELLGCWTEEMTVFGSATRAKEEFKPDLQQPEIAGFNPQHQITSSPLVNHTTLNGANKLLALPPGPSDRQKRRHSTRRPWILAFATFVLLLVFGVPTLIAISNKVRKPTSTFIAPSPDTLSNEPVSTTPGTDDSSQVSAKTDTTTTTTSPDSKREREHVLDEPRSDNTTKATVSTPAPPKEAAQSVASSEQPVQAEKATQPSATGQSVKVVMRIENGRVVQATVGDRRPGSEAYESLALRIARQRRYPAGVNKQETLIMKVDGPK